jgi:hypothetical protein
VNLVTPIPRRLAVPIIESLQFDCVMRDHDIDGVIPPPPEGLLPYRTAVRLALEREREGEVETSWRNAEVEGARATRCRAIPTGPGHTVYVDERERRSSAPPRTCGASSRASAVRTAGTRSRSPGRCGAGWTSSRRCRPASRPRDPTHCTSGDAVDFWRVEAIDRGTFLRLRAEMRVPGRAWLELGSSTAPDARARITAKRAVFFPKGLSGRLYWWAIFPSTAHLLGHGEPSITAEAEGERAGPRTGEVTKR